MKKNLMYVAAPFHFAFKTVLTTVITLMFVSSLLVNATMLTWQTGALAIGGMFASATGISAVANSLKHGNDTLKRKNGKLVAGTEQQCFDALYHWRWPNGFVCPNCGHDRGCQLTTHKLQQCYRCNRQTSITAGTIFEATKLPLTVWFQGIYFMTQDKKGASAMNLHRQLGISYNAAWRMRHKLMQVMMIALADGCLKRKNGKLCR